MDSIGEILKNERMNRGLSLQEVHDATRITVQNLSAIEEDRFDYFPNRVYARAFLRDYANFLGLDSVALVKRYEEGQSEGEPEVELAPVEPRGSAWKAVAYSLIGLLVLGALAAAVYFGSNYNKGARESGKVVTRAPQSEVGKVATLPKPDGAGKPIDLKPEPKTKPEPQPAPVTDKVVLNVTASEDVWMRVVQDGQKVFEGTLPKAQVKTFEGKKSVNIRTGKAGAVQLKLNGKPQPALGTLQEVGDKTFTLEEVKASAAGNAATEPKTPSSPNTGATR